MNNKEVYQLGNARFPAGELSLESDLLRYSTLSNAPQRPMIKIQAGKKDARIIATSKHSKAKPQVLINVLNPKKKSVNIQDNPTKEL